MKALKLNPTLTHRNPHNVERSGFHRGEHVAYGTNREGAHDVWRVRKMGNRYEATARATGERLSGRTLKEVGAAIEAQSPRFDEGKVPQRNPSQSDEWQPDYLQIEKRGRQHVYRILTPEGRVKVDWEYGPEGYDDTVEQAKARFGSSLVIMKAPHRNPPLRDNVYLATVRMARGKHRYFGAFAEFDEVIKQPGTGHVVTYVLNVAGDRLILQNVTPEGIYHFRSEDGATFTGEKVSAEEVKAKIADAVSLESPEDYYHDQNLPRKSPHRNPTDEEVALTTYSMPEMYLGEPTGETVHYANVAFPAGTGLGGILGRGYSPSAAVEDWNRRARGDGRKVLGVLMYEGEGSRATRRMLNLT